MGYTDVLLKDIVQDKMSPVTVGVGGEEKTFDVFRYANSISVPAPVDSQSSGNIQSILLGVEEDMNKMRFFYFRGDFNEQELAEITKIVQDDYDIDTRNFRDDKTLERKLGSYGIRNCDIKDIARGEMDIDDTVDKKIPSIPMNIEVVSDGEKIIFRYSVNYGSFVFSKIAKTVEPYYDKVSGTVRDEDELEKIIEDFGKTFSIERKDLVSAVYWGFDGRPLTPLPGIMFDFEKIYKVDDKGKIHVPEDDPVVCAIVDMIIKGKSTLVDKTVIEPHKGSSSSAS